MPDLQQHPTSFSTAVHGTVFATRMKVVRRLRGGDELTLIPDPPGTGDPAVWVHAPGGDVVGYLPIHIADWLAPWMLAGGRCRAYVERVGSDEVESWNRLVL